VHVWETIYLGYTEDADPDASDPGHPASSRSPTPGQESGSFNRVWGCPFFPSGTVIASDHASGLWCSAQRSYGWCG
jgi:hypothetical protein